jgi:hypothetical protein
MEQQRMLCRLAGVMMVCLLVGGLQTGTAAVVFDDHFTGGSGGIPADWSRILGTGAVVEQGTTVTLGDDEVAIGSDATIDPSSGTVRIETEFVGITGQGASGLIVPPAFPVTFFVCEIRPEDDRIEVTVGDAAGAMQSYELGHLVGYTGGPIRLTVILGPASFSVSTDSPPFSSGPIDYTAVFTTFTREDLGTAASVLLFDYSDPGTSIIDRILVDVEGATPVENVTFGTVKALYRR